MEKILQKGQTEDFQHFKELHWQVGNVTYIWDKMLLYWWCEEIFKKSKE